MQRNVLYRLKEFYDSGYPQPVCLTGARGVGKTFAASEFASSFFESHIYLNFENDLPLRELFDKADQNSDFWQLIALYLKAEGNLPSNILYIFDEISSCPRAYQLLTAFLREGQGNDLFIMAICSIRPSYGLELFNSVSVYPMSFDEFLTALGHEWYKDIIKAHFETMRRVPDIVHNELLAIFRDYLRVGGMPDAVYDYVKNRSFENTEERQKSLNGYNRSELLNCGEGLNIRTLQIYDSISCQFDDAACKFRFNRIRKGLTFNYYKDAFNYLNDCSMIIKCNKSLSEGQSYDREDESSFRLFYNDLGLLNQSLRGQVRLSASQSEKAILLSYLYQTLKCLEIDFSYWESDSRSLIDALARSGDGQLFPIEIKASGSRKGRIIDSFLGSNESCEKAYVLTESNFRQENSVNYIPMYALFCLKN